MSSTDKLSLEQRLANLLSISIDDDHGYVTEVLDSLIDIGDPNDVAEYLAGFVGDTDGGDGGNLQQFAQDVKRFSLGEDISSFAGNNDEPTTAAPAASVERSTKPKVLDEAAAQREEIKRREVEAREKQRKEQEHWAKKKEEEDEQQRRREAEAAAAQKQKREADAKKAQINKVNSSQTSTQKSSVVAKQNQSKGVQNKKAAAVSKEGPRINVKKQPQKGNPKNKPCGCYGNKHKPLTNCLHCGRISCEVEGINDYCHFCGNLIADFSSQIDSSDPAEVHKARLLEFDRTSAQRTHIHDDQEDYFVSSTSMWATQQEQDDAREMEEARQKKLHERQRQVLNINF